MHSICLTSAFVLCLTLSFRASGADGEPHQLTVALLQLAPHGNDLEANAEKAVQYCRQAAAQGADIALLPEMWSIGYTRFKADVPGDKKHFYTLARATNSTYVQQFATLAKELDMAIGFTYLQAWDPLSRNALTLFDRHGEEVFTYAKVHTSDFKSMERSMTPGDDFYVNTLDTKSGPVEVGAMICFDREQPESARILMLKGAEIILTPNACGLEEIRLGQFRTRACENAVGVAMANYAHPLLNGHSVAYTATGGTIVQASEEEGIFLATFNLDDLRKHRKKTIWGAAYRRPQRYGLLTSPEKAPVWDRIDGIGQPYDQTQR